MRTDIPQGTLDAIDDGSRWRGHYLVFHWPYGDQGISDVAGVQYATGRYCDALVTDWGELIDSMDVEAAISGTGSQTRQFTVTLANTSDTGWWCSRFADSPPENMDVDLYQAVDGGASVLIGRFVVQSPIDDEELSGVVQLTLLSVNQSADPYIGVKGLPVVFGEVKWLKGKLVDNKGFAVVSSLGSNYIVTDRDLGDSGWEKSGGEFSFYGLRKKGDFISHTKDYLYIEGNRIYFDSSHPAYVYPQPGAYIYAVTPVVNPFAYLNNSVAPGSVLLSLDRDLIDAGFSDNISTEIFVKVNGYTYRSSIVSITGSDCVIDQPFSNVITIPSGTKVSRLYNKFEFEFCSGPVSSQFRVKTSGPIIDYPVAGRIFDYNNDIVSISYEKYLPINSFLTAKEFYDPTDYAIVEMAQHTDEVFLNVNYREESENPADILTSILEKMGLDYAIDSSSFESAKSWFSVNGYRMSGFVDGGMRCSEVIRDVCWQSRSYLVWDAGKVFLRIRYAVSSTPVSYISTPSNRRYGSIVRRRQEVSLGAKLLGDTERQDSIVNALILRYQQTVEGDFASQLEVVNQDSINKIRRAEGIRDAYLVQSDSYAKALANFWVGETAWPQSIISCNAAADGDILSLQIGDAASLVTDWSDIGYFIGRVVSITRILGQAAPMPRANEWKITLVGINEARLITRLGATMGQRGYSIVTRGPLTATLAAAFGYSGTLTAWIVVRLFMYGRYGNQSVSFGTRGPLTASLSVARLANRAQAIVTSLYGGFGYGPMGNFFWGW